MECMECNPKVKAAEAVGAQRRCASTPTVFGPLKCIVCHSDDIQAREVYEELKVEQDIVLYLSLALWPTFGKIAGVPRSTGPSPSCVHECL